MIYTLDQIKDGTGFDPGATFITAGAPLSERAPEVAELLAEIREYAEGDSWPGADTVMVLCAWFTRHGYDVGPQDETEPDGCEACGAEAGEQCRPMCIGQAAQQDAAGVDLTEGKPCGCEFTCCPHCSHWPGPHVTEGGESEGCTCCQTRSLAGQADHECARCGHLGKSHVTCNKPLSTEGGA